MPTLRRTMDDPTYRFRLSRSRKETTYRLADQALAWSDGQSGGALDFADMRQISISDSPGVGGLPGFTRCTIRPRVGRAVILSSNHFGGIGDWESRIENFRPFVDALLRRAARANPRIAFISGLPTALWVTWIVSLVVLVIITPLGIATVAIEGKEMSASFHSALAICVGLLLGFFPFLRLVRRNRPRRFDGREGYPD
jgi:hypothetical protein